MRHACPGRRESAEDKGGRGAELTPLACRSKPRLMLIVFGLTCRESVSGFFAHAARLGLEAVA